MTTIDVGTLALSLSMAVAAGLVGCFAVMRRMTLAADAISHVALPGIGVALALRVHPFYGGMAMLLIGALLIWGLEHRTKLSTETVTGVVFSAALAVGALLATGEELMEVLFGAPSRLSAAELVLGLVGSAAVVAFVLVARHRLVVSLVSSEIAHTAGIHVSRLNLLYLTTFAMTVGLGLRYLGVLLIGSLIIIPAATARNLARSLNAMLAWSVILAVASTVVGTYAALAFHQKTGPLIITVAASLFFVSLLTRRR